MFTHHKLKVYQKALECAGSAERISVAWARKHSVVDHFSRASESIVLNIAQGARRPSGPAKVLALDYALGSALESAACLDVARIKGLLPVGDASTEKRRFWEITRMLIGLRKSWHQSVINEEPTLYPPSGPNADPQPLFHHETLDVYQVSLDFMGWLNSLPGNQDLSAQTHRQLDKASTSLVLNIAEGNGRYSELDHRRFLNVAAESAVKTAAYLDLCQHKTLPAGTDTSYGMNLLGRITAMLSNF